MRNHWRNWIRGLGAVCAIMMFSTPTLTYATALEPGMVGRSIILDAGHGGPDGGARGQTGEIEKNITLSVTLKLAEYLRQSGAMVYFTRDSDKDLATDLDRERKQRHRGDLKGRLAAVRACHPSAFLSIHCNAVPSSVWRGAQTLYFTENVEGKAFAEALQESMKRLLLPTEREIQKNDTLYLLKRIKGPAALAEIGFLSNAEEARAMMNPRYQQKVAFALYLGILSYYGQIDGDMH